MSLRPVIAGLTCLHAREIRIIQEAQLNFSSCTRRKNLSTPPPKKFLVVYRFEFPYVHGGHVALMRFPDLLHHLLLGQTAGLDGALDGDGPLWVVQGQVLQAGGGGRG